MHLTSRRGFTLVELLVAVVLINVGLLALVGSSAAIVRRHIVIRARAAALQAAAARLELLAAGPCATLASSAALGVGARENWSSTLLPNRVREFAESVSYVASGATAAAITLRTRTPC